MQTARTEDWAKSWAKGSSPLNGPLLALVNEGPGYPYAYRGRIVQRLGDSWLPPLMTIYRILERFEGLGLASSHPGDSKLRGMPVTIYEATELTPVAVADWMESPLRELPLRGALAIRIAVSRPADAPYLLRAIAEHQRQCFALLTKYRRKYPTNSWRGMEMESARQGIILRIEAELQWLHIVRGYIEDFLTEGSLRAFRTAAESESGRSKAWQKGSSALNGPLLALLNDRPGHPSELARRLCERLGPEWETEITSISRMLERFERDGLASSRAADSSRNGKPVKIYEATELTSVAVADWMQSPLPELPLRGPLAVRIAVSRPTDAPQLERAFEQHRQTCFGVLERHKKKQRVASWSDMEVELTRQGVGLQIGAELKWTDVVQRYFADFQGPRRVVAVV